MTLKHHHFRLIDSTYDQDEATEILSALVSSKINFLNMKIFSMKERYGEDSVHLKERVRDLEKELRTLQLLLDEFDGEHVEYEIGCAVQIAVKVPADLA